MGLDVKALARIFRLEDRPDIRRLHELGLAGIREVANITSLGPLDFDIELGQYWAGPDSGEMEWRVSSYGEFGAFRQRLAWLFPETDRFLKFRAANDHSTIFGTEACKQLAEDFLWGQDRVHSSYRLYGGSADGDDPDWVEFVRIYTQFLNGFRFAADGGLLGFC